MIQFALLFLALIMSGLVACKTTPQTPVLPSITPTPFSGTVPAPSPTTGAADRAWHVKLALSGGFIGLDRTLDLSSDGALVVVDRRTGKQITRRLSEQELAAIAALVASAQPAPAANRMPGCADCYQYGLDVQRGGQGFSAQMNDVSLPDSGVEPLVRALTRLMDQSLSGP